MRENFLDFIEKEFHELENKMYEVEEIVNLLNISRLNMAQILYNDIFKTPTSFGKFRGHSVFILDNDKGCKKLQFDKYAVGLFYIYSQ